MGAKAGEPRSRSTPIASSSATGSSSYRTLSGKKYDPAARACSPGFLPTSSSRSRGEARGNSPNRPKRPDSAFGAVGQDSMEESPRRVGKRDHAHAHGFVAALRVKAAGPYARAHACDEQSAVLAVGLSGDPDQHLFSEQRGLGRLPLGLRNRRRPPHRVAARDADKEDVNGLAA